jgi:hypothetical protein
MVSPQACAAWLGSEISARTPGEPSLFGSPPVGPTTPLGPTGFAPFMCAGLGENVLASALHSCGCRLTAKRASALGSLQDKPHRPRL